MKYQLAEVLGFLCHTTDTGMPPVKWSAHWDMIVPLLGGLNDGWKARETRRYCAEASSS